MNKYRDRGVSHQYILIDDESGMIYINQSETTYF